jgi:hypothetical protein
MEDRVDETRRELVAYLRTKLPEEDVRKASKLIAKYTVACISRRLDHRQDRDIWKQMAEALNLLRTPLS